MNETGTDRILPTPNKNFLTYQEDGRKPIEDLWKDFDKLAESGLFEKQEIFSIAGVDSTGKEVRVPTFAYISKAQGPSIWILSGIHGEEPAGPNAIADKVDSLIDMAKSDIPMVVAPLVNGLGYMNDDRYYNIHRGSDNSVTDMEHELGRKAEPKNEYSKKAGEWVKTTAETHTPVLLFDHHEDEIDHQLSVVDAESSYSYSYGSDIEKISELSQDITRILVDSGFPIMDNGETRFGEKVVHGFVPNSPDGSVDEFLTTLGLKAGFVIETTRDDSLPIKLETRVRAHSDVIDMYPSLWEKVKH